MSELTNVIMNMLPEHLRNPDFYWIRDCLATPVLEDHSLWLSNARCAYSATWLSEHRITHVLNVASELHNNNNNNNNNSQTATDNIVRHSLPIDDSEHDEHKMFNLFHVAFEWIESARRTHGNSARIVVHCLAGVSRSATIVIGYLWQYHRNRFPTIGHAYKHVQELRIFIRPNIGFFRALNKLEQQQSIAK